MKQCNLCKKWLMFGQPYCRCRLHFYREVGDTVWLEMHAVDHEEVANRAGEEDFDNGWEGDPSKFSFEVEVSTGEEGADIRKFKVTAEATVVFEAEELE